MHDKVLSSYLAGHIHACTKKNIKLYRKSNQPYSLLECMELNIILYSVGLENRAMLSCSLIKLCKFYFDLPTLCSKDL